MFEDKVFIIKLAAKDGFASGAVVVGEVTALAHKLRDDTMKAAALKAKALLVRAQAAEVLYKGDKERWILLTFRVQFVLGFFFNSLPRHHYLIHLKHVRTHKKVNT